MYVHQVATMGVRKRVDDPPAAPGVGAATAAAAAADVDAAAAAAAADALIGDVRCSRLGCRRVIPRGDEIIAEQKWFCWNCAFIHFRAKRRRGEVINNVDSAWLEAMEEEIGARIE